MKGEHHSAFIGFALRELHLLLTGDASILEVSQWIEATVCLQLIGNAASHLLLT